jgi:hypothetical protein
MRMPGGGFGKGLEEERGGRGTATGASLGLPAGDRQIERHYQLFYKFGGH